jgi:hypothetical protein
MNKAWLHLAHFSTESNCADNFARQIPVIDVLLQRFDCWSAAGAKICFSKLGCFD